ncbi:MAG: selenocysteine-specific translation elongation factor [Vicinamibacterales bacterium]|jgi:selenocysteine-specific elongation factor|nr:selenocysteine-specific translation elongation factor [Acidobacteriota bacterium]MDP6373927.1 selenocysteine-specific translation elongation factor [Vicinamibacterales bacterium]MDP6610535.1 selenocysteine-specific translation elongation factor [Vicinamibacterales bacterium]|tara:strand:+ start:2326 stop:4296 length:1971 start_codon:yes stop_codon:yes gene_type:complete
MKTTVIGTAGHIDHGKSTLVRALTGTDPDRLKEEKDRGITIDLGFAHYAQPDGAVLSFVDVPGHERFVKNMLAGVSGINAVLLVVAADESVMPQTREHFDICRLLHVGRGVIALTKADLVDAETLELAKLEVSELVADSFLVDAPIVPVSAVGGDGLDALKSALAEVTRDAPAAGGAGAVRLPIDRVFSMRGFGTVVTGTLATGQLNVDGELLLLPAGRRVKVRGLQVHGAKQAQAEAGRRVAVNLGGVELAEVSRGESLVTPDCFETTRRFDGVVELLASAKPLRHGARVRFHHGTSEVLGRVAVSGPVGAAPDSGSAGRSVADGEITPGGSAYVRVRLEAPAVLTRGDRYVLRAYSPSMTIAGGVVLDPQPPRLGVRTVGGRRRFDRLNRPPELSSVDDRLLAAARVVIEEQAGHGLEVSALVRRLGASSDALERIVEQLEADGAAVRVGDRLVAPAVLDAGRDHLLAALSTYHRDHPLSEGLPREEARERLFRHADASVFERVLADLVAGDRIAARGHLALVSHRVSLSADEERARDAIAEAVRQGGLAPPDAAGLAALGGVDAAVGDRVVKLLIRQKVLVKVDALVFHAETLLRLKTEVSALKPEGSVEPVRVDVGTFKERYDITRKYAIPLLEFLDRERVTRRVGQGRVVL